MAVEKTHNQESRPGITETLLRQCLAGQDNDLTTDIAVSDPSTAEEMETAILSMVTTLINYKDDVNEPLNKKGLKRGKFDNRKNA